MSGYNSYNAAYHGGEDSMQQMSSSGNGSNMMMMMGSSGMEQPGMVGGQSLDDIVNQNARNIRRQSLPQSYNAAQDHTEADMRRMTMMDFNGLQSPDRQLNNFQFAPASSIPQESLNGIQQRRRPDRDRPSNRDLSLSTSMNSSFNAANGSPYSMMASGSSYQTPGRPTLDMDIASPFMHNTMGMPMEFTNEQAFVNVMDTDSQQMSMYGQPQYHQQQQQPMMTSPMHHQPEMQPSLQPPPPESRGGAFDNRPQRPEPASNHSSSDAVRQLSRSSSMQLPSSNSPQRNSPLHQQSQSGQMYQPSTFQRQQQNTTPGGFTPHSQQQQQPQSQTQPAQQQINSLQQSARPDPGRTDQQTPSTGTQKYPWEEPEGGWPSLPAGKPHTQTAFKNIYSTTGFDMLGVLMRVATRPNPEINLGSVDLSCAFAVSDAEQDDMPMIYCSDNFERLTGYTRHMILGRNCRFLQSPEGNVESGTRRKYVDDDSVLYLKNMIAAGREAQISLINYRRGGQPFMNLLTLIPIRWDSDKVKFYVGFQVDLVEQPNAVTSRNADGSYSVNYQRGMTMPRYVMNAPEATSKQDFGQTIPRDDVSAILSTIGTGESEYAKRMWDKVLLENTDDVVHVLSLKGLFQWVSPSALKVLEYEPGEIIGTALSSVCHPSDIVPVTRELKDTSTGASVNVVFRIRRKNSGYMWFEGHGSLHTEQGKGRKSIIMVGRERPVYTLNKNEIVANGGIGENELWTKMSTSGMFLFVSSNVRQLLDRQPEELVGVSIQSLMRSDSKADFGRILEHARTGKKASVKHEVINRRGQVLQAFTTLYPGDATEGQKPTFIVAQTRLIKHSRVNGSNKPSMYAKGDRASSESVNTNNTNLTVPGQLGQASEGGTPSVASSMHNFIPTETNAATYGGNNGLAIGHQDVSLASEDNLFDELKTTKSSSWQYEIRQLEKRNRLMAEEVQALLAAKKKRKRRKGAGQLQKDCANCHTRVTPEWRRGPSGQRDLCNSCGLRWAKLNGRISPRTNSQHSVHSATSDKASKASASPRHIGMSASQMPGVKAEISPGSSGTSSGDQQQTQQHSSQMEGANGVPEKIDEGVEPL